MLDRIMLCSLFLLLGSCGKKDGAGDAVPEPIDSRPVFSLSGLASTTWVQDCQEIKERQRSVRSSLTLNDNTFEIRDEYFDGLTCDEGLKRSTFFDRRKKVYKDDREKIPGWTTYSNVVDSISLALRQQRLVAIYNDNKSYGLQGWELNVEKNISGLAYDAESEKERSSGHISERTILIEDNKLYFATYEGDIPVANLEHPYMRQ